MLAQIQEHINTSAPSLEDEGDFHAEEDMLEREVDVEVEGQKEGEDVGEEEIDAERPTRGIKDVREEKIDADADCAQHTTEEKDGEEVVQHVRDAEEKGAAVLTTSPFDRPLLEPIHQQNAHNRDRQLDEEQHSGYSRDPEEQETIFSNGAVLWNELPPNVVLGIALQTVLFFWTVLFDAPPDPEDIQEEPFPEAVPEEAASASKAPKGKSYAHLMLDLVIFIDFFNEVDDRALDPVAFSYM